MSFFILIIGLFFACGTAEKDDTSANTTEPTSEPTSQPTSQPESIPEEEGRVHVEDCARLASCVKQEVPPARWQDCGQHELGEFILARSRIQDARALAGHQVEPAGCRKGHM